ncbi:MAG: ATP phosphoribosyltransferase [Candidatus Nanohaloarchaea archaeon]
MADIAIPKNSSMNRDALQFYRDEGYAMDELEPGSRCYRQEVGEDSFYLMKAQDIPSAVYSGKVDEGVTGFDILLDYACREDIPLSASSFEKLGFAEADIVLASPSGGLPDSGPVTVATSYPGLAENYLRGRYEQIDVREKMGSVELFPCFEDIDGILEVKETGNTLEKNDLEVVEKVLGDGTEAVRLKNPEGQRRDRELEK